MEDAWGGGGGSRLFLQAFPVTKTTPQGAWIDTDAEADINLYGTSPTLSWSTADWHRTRWVANGSGASWAKLTREEAILSAAIRLSRWARFIRNDADKALSRAASLRAFRPDLDGYAKIAEATLDLTVRIK